MNKPKNQNAKKPLDQVASSHINIRVLTSNKSKWVARAQKDGKNLTQWVIDKLNSECDK